MVVRLLVLLMVVAHVDAPHDDTIVVHLRYGLVAGPPPPEEPIPDLLEAILRLVRWDGPIHTVVVGDKLAEVALGEALRVVHL